MNGGEGEHAGFPGLGWQLDGYRLDTLLGAGPLSWVAVGTRPDGQRHAFKIAGPFPMANQATFMDVLPTQAYPTLSLDHYSEGYYTVPVNPLALLQEQWRKLRAVRDQALISVEGPEPTPKRPWYRMPYVTPACTLRSMLRAREPVPVDVALALTQALARLKECPSFNYHGDVKPENILVTPTGPILIDPGHFGPLAATPGWGDAGGAQSHVIVTTPAYNHGLYRDDLVALGVVLWEIAFGEHPFSRILPNLLDGRTHTGDDVWQFFGRDLGSRLTPDLLARSSRSAELRYLLGRGVVGGLDFTETIARLTDLRVQGVEYLRVCGDDSCANPGRLRCALCRDLFCLDHRGEPADLSGDDGWKCSRHPASPPA